MKLCVIGSRGHVGQVFDNLGNVPEVQLGAISSGSDDSPLPLLKMAERVGLAPKIYPDWHEMLHREKPDCVAVDGPFELHAEMSRAALEVGSHVFCEKPIALTLSDLERLETAWRASGRHIRSMIGLQNNPPFLHAWELVRSGAVGKVKMIRAQKSYRLGERPGFYRHNKTYGGTIPWVGIHAFLWILAFSGSEIDCCHSTQTVSDNRGHGELEIACQCQMVMKNGVQAQASMDFLRPECASTHGDDQLRVAGTDGILEIRHGVITLTDAAGERTIPVPVPEPGRRLFPEFIRSLTNSPGDYSPDRETFALTRACLLARDSAVSVGAE